MIEEKNPLKQGLKLVVQDSDWRVFKRIEEKNPLKQGLKQIRFTCWSCYNWIEEKNPLKQGLKRNAAGNVTISHTTLKRRIH